MESADEDKADEAAVSENGQPDEPCEDIPAFFMRVSRKRGLLAEEKNASTNHQDTKRPMDYALKDGPIHGASTNAKPSGLQSDSPFFMPVSTKRRLLAEENNALTNHHDTKRRKDEVLKDAPIHGASTKVKRSGLQSDSPKRKKTSSNRFSGPSQVPENVLRVKTALDSKLTTQDDALRNVGKPIHPLFLRAKASTTKAASSSNEVGYLEPCPPTHVTQCLEEESTERKDERFHVNQPIIERCKEEALVHRLMQSGHSLKDNLLISRSSVPPQKKVDMLSKGSAICLPNSGTNHHDRSQAPSSQHGLENLLVYLLESAAPRRTLMGAYVQPLPDRVMDDITSTEELKEMLSWYTARHDSLLSTKDNGAPSLQKNMLWTDVYQPKSSKEVCGNRSGVEFLNTWLQSWRERMMGVVSGADSSQSNATSQHHDSDSDRGWFEGDSDSDTGTDEESGLHSNLLVTGPTGCGKTAAIYACAAEQGLTVIEINASSCRSGASLTQKFGKGGLESQAVGKWSGFEDQASPMEEADEIHTMPQIGRKISQHVRGKGKKEGKALGATGSRNPKAPMGKSAVGRKLYDFCASDDCEESLGVGVDEPQPRSLRKKKMTVILFEDVDLHFEEDRGFLASLVQLAKTTKRPIILTSTSRQPGLHQILEKTRIDFCYPSPQELTLHASMVCLAEGVACSPWMVSRLVESCQCDMRKVIMSLQFWGQDSCSWLTTSSNVTSSSNGTSWDLKTSYSSVKEVPEKSVSENPRESRRRLSLRPYLPNLNALPPSPTNMDDKCLRGIRANAFRQWDSEARYLYDLDIHHIILPDMFSSNSPCHLSLDVASRINAAVSELEKHEIMSAVKDAEQQGLALQAQLNAAEAERKALRKAKDATRRASRVKTKVVEDEAPVCGDLSANVNTYIPEDRELCVAVESACGTVDLTGSKVDKVSGNDPSPPVGGDLENLTGVEKSGCLEMEDSTSQVSLSGDGLADECANVSVRVETRSEFVNPVQQAWRALQDQRQALRHLLRPVPSSIYACHALATVLDVISASSTISSFSSESRKTHWTTFRSTWNGAFEGNIRHCSFWENSQEIASQLVRAGLQSFSTASLVTCRDNRLPVALGILAAAKDVPAVGKCMVTCDDVKSQLKTIEKTYSKEESTRQSIRQERLDEIIQTRFLPKGRITGVSLLDYIAYLARINQLEEDRRTLTAISTNQRSRRFQHHLSLKMSDADIAEFRVLCRFVKA